MFCDLKKWWVVVIIVASLPAFAEDQAGDRKASSTSASSPVGRREEGDYVIEKKADGTTVKYKKKNSYDFEGDSIDGLNNKPSGSYISNIKDVKGRSIIRIRENFDAEVVDSSRLLK